MSDVVIIDGAEAILTRADYLPSMRRGPAGTNAVATAV